MILHLQLGIAVVYDFDRLVQYYAKCPDDELAFKRVENNVEKPFFPFLFFFSI